MIESVIRNWKDSLTEVTASLIGTLGIVLVIAFILSGQDTEDVSTSFFRYFNEGQIGLSSLAVSGVMFLSLRKHGKINSLVSMLLYAFFIIPILATAFIIGLNPGFEKNVLVDVNVSRLWMFYFWLHFLWFLIRVFEPAIPSGEVAGAKENERVKSIADRASKIAR